MVTSAFGASVANLANGYYRISNDFTKRYIQVVENHGSLNYQSASADMAAIRLLLGLENVISDPASVLYIEKQSSGKYDIKAQNTGIYDIIKSHVNIIDNGSSYWAYGAQNDATLYLYDVLGAYGDLSTPESALSTNKSDKYPNARNWKITPIDNSTENYFGITPSVTSQGKYYQPFYADFPFSCASDGMKVFYVTKIDENKGELFYKEIKGTVPALTPVIIECSSPDPANNKLNIGGKADPITDNKLKGVLYEFHEKKHENFVTYNASTMRLLGNTANGDLGGVIAKFPENAKYKDVPRNTIYIPVSNNAPAEFKFVDESSVPVDVESITLSATTAQIELGETVELTATVVPENATNKTVTWKSSDESVAKVDAAGKVTSIKEGKATITASCGSVSATCEVTVVIPIIPAESITLNETTAELKMGETLTLTATVLPENTTDKKVAWTSSDESIARVDANGKVSAISVGNVTITATCGDATASCVITVAEAPVVSAESITLSEQRAELKVGETVSITATVLPENTTDKKVIWTSSDESIATVDGNGIITAVAVGNATITATCGEATASCAVTVTEVPVVSAESITLSEQSAELKVGESLRLTATVLPENATDKKVTWTSSDESIATVNTLGRITAVAVGTVTITATCGDITATCTVTVIEEPAITAQFITLSMNDAKMKAGENLILIATVLPENAVDKSVVWTTSDASVATVDSYGLVSAVNAGEAIITATCGSVSASCAVYVEKEEPKGEEKQFVGTLEIDMVGEVTTLENQKLDILDIRDGKCILTLHNFNLGDGTDLGDIMIEDVAVSENDGVITYKSDMKELLLAGGVIKAEADCDGTENADGIITIVINVNWNNKHIKVVFTNEVSGIFDITAEDDPAEYYHINGVKATGLTPGLYIKVQGGKATKVLVK